MGSGFGAAGPTKSRVHITMVIIAIVVSLLTGCNNSSDSPSMTEPTENTGNSAQLEDPAGAIANLEFLSAEHDASYQCLLSAAQASATTRGMQASPVLDEDNPIGRGVYATWCKTVGSSDAVNADLASCVLHKVDDVSAPGSEALRLYATRERAPGNAIQRIELKSIKTPIDGSVDFKVEYTRSIGSDENYFGLKFVPSDGNTYNDDLRVIVGSNNAYINSDDGVREYYYPERTPAEQKSLLMSSAAQFKATVTTDWEALKVQVEQAVNNDNSLDASAKQAVIATATTEIDRRISLIDQNSEMLHSLLLEQFSIEECGL